MKEDSGKKAYKINYFQCKKGREHEGESLNYICLQKGCINDCLICSICRNESHQQHSTKPFKSYFEELKKQYDETFENYEQQLFILEERKNNFLLHLKEVVEHIASQFMKFQEEMIQKFQSVKNQIREKETKKNQFQDLYESLTSNTIEDLNFLIKNYLPKETIGLPSEFNELQNLKENINGEVQKIKNKFLSSNVKVHDFVQDTNFVLANSVLKKNNIFIQKNSSPQSTCMNLFKTHPLTDFKNKKIKVKVLKVKKGSYITIGAITKKLFQTLNFKAPSNWTNAAYNNELFFYNNCGNSFGHAVTNLKTFSQNSVLEISMIGKKMRITMNKNKQEYKLSGNKQFYFFFCIQGNTEIEVELIK